MSERIYENDLRLPALYLISMRNGNINTSELSNMLRDILKPSGDDLEILANLLSKMVLLREILNQEVLFL